MDVFYKDVKPHEVFDPEKDWLIAATDIPVNGRTGIDWEDSGNLNRKSVGKIFARYYLVGRADIDLDQDGIPDARERFVFNREGHEGDLQVTGFTGLASATNSSLATGSLTNSLSFTNSTALKRPFALRCRIIYVDRRIGADHLSGKGSVVVSPDGPKKTINGGLNAVEPGGIMIIQDGMYEENLRISGKDVKVKIQGKVRL